MSRTRKRVNLGHLVHFEVLMLIYCVVVEAHCYALQCRQIDCEQIRSRINQPLIAGCFGPKAFVSCVQNVLYAADEGLRAKTSCN